MNAIEIDNLTKVYRLYKSHHDRVKEIISLNTRKYHHDFYALKDVSFNIKKGETVGIIGQNGSGKSTLLKIICGVSKSTSGTVKVNGRISSLLELGAGFHQDFTGRENVYMNGALMGFSKEEMESRLPEIEAFADIGEFIDQPVKSYSSGMYVRLAFAAAINVDPEILIVDEAISVGDSRFQLKCFFKFQELQERQKTILFVTHDMNTIKKYCSNAILLNKGQLIFEGSPNDATNRYVQILFPADNSTRQYMSGQKSKKEEACLPTSDIEYRYGSGHGEIASIALLDNLGQVTNVFTSGEEMKVVFRVVAHCDIATPIMAMTVKDAKGWDIYSTNTFFKGITMPGLTTGSEIEVTFTQKLYLIPANYFISLGFVHIDNGNIVPLDRRYDVIEIKVLPKNKETYMGIVNLDSEISVKQCGRHDLAKTYPDSPLKDFGQREEL